MTEELDLTKPLQTCLGEKAELVYDGLTGNYPLVVITYHDDGTNSLQTYRRNGFHYMDESSSFNLVNVPERGECWVNIYPDNIPNAHPTRERADRHARPGRIACVRVEYEEGEGL